jgi:hypothetical protein
LAKANFFVTILFFLRTGFSKEGLSNVKRLQTDRTPDQHPRTVQLN